MVLEATMICVDNSEWMRNGDYSPTRLQAQIDAVNLICGGKTQSHAESTVGILTMAGKGVRVLITPTSDLGKILACTHGLEIGGESNIAAAVQVAQLSLKHRQNKEQRQRIVLFCGSPVKIDKKTLESIGKKLKKMNVALDIVDFGEEDDEKPEKLESLISTVNSGENSHIVHIPPGPNVLSNLLISSPIVTGEGDGGSGFAAAAAAGSAAAVASGIPGFEFGVDPNLDPELALALRVSMEEERARQEAAARRAAEEATTRVSQEAPDQERNLTDDVSMAEATSAVEERGAPQRDSSHVDDDKSLLDQALAMSMPKDGAVAAGDTTMMDAIGEDQELAIALQMSMNESSAGSSSADVSQVLGDQMFVSSILAALPGVDPNDPSVRDIIAALESEQQKKEKNEKDDEEQK